MAQVVSLRMPWASSRSEGASEAQPIMHRRNHPYPTPIAMEILDDIDAETRLLRGRLAHAQTIASVNALHECVRAADRICMMAESLVGEIAARRRDLEKRQQTEFNQPKQTQY